MAGLGVIRRRQLDSTRRLTIIGIEQCQCLLGTKLVYPFHYGSPRWRRLFDQPIDRSLDSIITGRLRLHFLNSRHRIDPHPNRTIKS